jgi:hypothetical protein
MENSNIFNDSAENRDLGVNMLRLIYGREKYCGVGRTLSHGCAKVSMQPLLRVGKGNEIAKNGETKIDTPR